MKHFLLYLIGFGSVDDIAKGLHSFKRHFGRHEEMKRVSVQKNNAKSQKFSLRATSAETEAERAAHYSKGIDELFGPKEGE